MRAIPTINTARLTLRAFLPQDFEAYAEWWGREDVVKFVGGVPRDRSEAWTSFLRNAGHWQMTGFGQWALQPRGADRPMGQVGFFYGSSPLGDDFDAHPEAGWILHPDAQGEGYAREAVAAAHEWFDRVVTGPLVCRMVPENVASRAVADAIGYSELRKTEQAGERLQLMLRKNPPRSNPNLLA